MSIYSLMARRVQAPRVRRRTAGEVSSADIASALAVYLPTEAVAAYTAILAFLVPADVPLNQQHYAGRAALAVAVGVLAAGYSVGIYYRKCRQEQRAFAVPVAPTAMVLFAFAGWVCVIPGTPLNGIDGFTPAAGAVIGILVNLSLGVVALFLDP